MHNSFDEDNDGTDEEEVDVAGEDGDGLGSRLLFEELEAAVLVFRQEY